MNEKSEVMTTEQLAEYLTVKPITILEWRKQKKIPYIKLVGTVRYLKSDIDKWVNSQVIPSSK